MTFIFVHIPKTAGTSFRTAAKQSLTCAWDYGLDSPETSDVIKETVYDKKPGALAEQISQRKIEFLSGHFIASKYHNLVPNGKLIGFVRDPVSRLISEYNHHVRHGGYKGSLEVFCSNAGHHNVQSKYFSGLSLDDFYFVGVTERYSESLELFNRSSDLSLPELKTNKAVDRSRDAREVSRSNISSALLQAIREQNRQDSMLYHSAVARLESMFLATA